MQGTLSAPPTDVGVPHLTDMHPWVPPVANMQVKFQGAEIELMGEAGAGGRPAGLDVN